MAKYRKQPVVIEAFTFDEFVTYGRNYLQQQDLSLGPNGMPWSFEFRGHPITHENDTCYLIPTLEGTMRFTPDDMLIVGVKGEIYPCKLEIFKATYEREYAPHQQRVIEEYGELCEKLRKLQDFMCGKVFKTLPVVECQRMEVQEAAMYQYAEALSGRIAAF